MEANENGHLLLSLSRSKALSRLNVVITATTSVSRSKQIGILHRAELHSDIATRSLSIVNGIPVVAIITTKAVRRICIEIFVRRKVANTITINLKFKAFDLLLGIQHPLSILLSETVANSINIHLNVTSVIGRTPSSAHFVTNNRTQIPILIIIQSNRFLQIFSTTKLLRSAGIVHRSSHLRFISNNRAIRSPDGEIVVLWHPKNILVVIKSFSVCTSFLGILLLFTQVADRIVNTRCLDDLSVLNIASRVMKSKIQFSKFISSTFYPIHNSFIIPISNYASETFHM